MISRTGNTSISADGDAPAAGACLNAQASVRVSGGFPNKIEVTLKQYPVFSSAGTMTPAAPQWDALPADQVPKKMLICPTVPAEFLTQGIPGVWLFWDIHGPGVNPGS